MAKNHLDLFYVFKSPNHIAANFSDLRFNEIKAAWKQLIIVIFSTKLFFLFGRAHKITKINSKWTLTQ